MRPHVEILHVGIDGREDGDDDLEAFYDLDIYEEDYEDPEWTDEMEAGLEEWEERRRERIALENEY